MALSSPAPRPSPQQSGWYVVQSSCRAIYSRQTRHPAFGRWVRLGLVLMTGRWRRRVIRGWGLRCGHAVRRAGDVGLTGGMHVWRADDGDETRASRDRRVLLWWWWRPGDLETCGRAGLGEGERGGYFLTTPPMGGVTTASSIFSDRVRGGQCDRTTVMPTIRPHTVLGVVGRTWSSLGNPMLWATLGQGATAH